MGNGTPGVQIHTDQAVDGIDHADGVGAALNRSPGGIADIRDIGRQLHDHGNFGYLRHPLGVFLDQFRYLPDGGTHPPFGHPVGTAEVQFKAVDTRILDPLDQFVPPLSFGFHHQRGHDGPIRKFPFDFPNFPEVVFQRAIRDQFDVVHPEHAPVSHPQAGKAGGNVYDRIPQRLPHRTAPARLKGAHHLVAAVGRRRGRQPEGVGAFYTRQIDRQIRHFHSLPCITLFVPGSSSDERSARPFSPVPQPPRPSLPLVPAQRCNRPRQTPWDSRCGSLHPPG